MSDDLTIEHLLEGLDGLANMAALFLEQQNQLRERRHQEILAERRKLRELLDVRLTQIASMGGHH